MDAVLAEVLAEVKNEHTGDAGAVSLVADPSLPEPPGRTRPVDAVSAAGRETRSTTLDKGGASQSGLGARRSSHKLRNLLKVQLKVAHGVRRWWESLCLPGLPPAGASGRTSQVSGNNYNQTPLHFAARLGYTAAAKELLEAGADASLEDINGDTALDRAESKGNHEVAELLRGHAAAVCLCRSRTRAEPDARPSCGVRRRTSCCASAPPSTPTATGSPSRTGWRTRPRSSACTAGARSRTHRQVR